MFDPFASPHRPKPSPRAAPVAAADAPMPSVPQSFLERLREIEATLLSDALAVNKFNQRRTAEALGLSYHQLRHYLKKHALLAPR